MRAEELTVEVRDVNLNRLGQVLPRDLVLEAHIRWCNVGEWKLTLPGNHPMVPALRTPGSGLLVTWRDPATLSTQVIFSGPTTMPSRSRGVDSPDGTLVFTGVTDDILLQDALAYPQPGNADVTTQTQANDTRTNTAESLLRQYVAYNIANGAVSPGGAVAWAPAGRLKGFRNYLVLEGPDNATGAVLTKSPRFQNLLNLCQEIVVGSPTATFPGIGFRVYQNGSLLYLQNNPVRDLRDTVRFDVNTGTLTSEQVSNQGPGLTRPIVAGQGEGTDRTMVTASLTTTSADETAWGRVIETFFDRRDTNDPTQLTQKAIDELNSADGGTAAKIVPSDDTTMRYLADWKPGDWVKVVIDGGEYDSVITEAVLLFDKDKSAVGAALGDVTAYDPRDVATSKQNSLDARVSYLERAAESPKIDVGTQKIGILPNTFLYRGSVGATKVIIDGVLSPVAYEWRTTYDPQGPRSVVLTWDGTKWTITGQTFDAKSIHPLAGDYPLTLATDWWPYDIRQNTTEWSDGRVHVTTAGIVSISGLIQKNGTPALDEVIASVPAALAPDSDIHFHANNSDGIRSVVVMANGNIRTSGSPAFGAGSFVGLDHLKWPAKGVATWTNIGSGGSSWGPNFTDYNYNGVPAAFWKDPYGFVWFRGLAKVVTTPTLDNTRIINLPASCVTTPTKGEQHFRTTGNEVYSGIGSTYVAGQGTLNWKTNSVSNVGGWIALAPALVATADAYANNNWWNVPFFTNSWQNNGPNQPDVGATRRGDGLVVWKGLASLGSFGTKLAVMDRDLVPRETKLMESIANNGRGRVDMFGLDRQGGSGNFYTGSLYMNQGTAGSWFGFDGIAYVP